MLFVVVVCACTDKEDIVNASVVVGAGRREGVGIIDKHICIEEKRTHLVYFLQQLPYCLLY